MLWTVPTLAESETSFRSDMRNAQQEWREQQRATQQQSEEEWRTESRSPTERGGIARRQAFLRYDMEMEKISRQEDAERQNAIQQVSEKWMSEWQRIIQRRDAEAVEVRRRADVAAEEIRRRGNGEPGISWSQRVAELNRNQRQADAEMAEIVRQADAEIIAIGHQEETEQRNTLNQISEKWTAERNRATFRRDREIEEIVRLEEAQRSAANEEERGENNGGGRTHVPEAEEIQRVFADTTTPRIPSAPSPGTPLSPGEAMDDATMVLKWRPVDGATSYDLGIRDMLTGQLVVDRRVDSASYSAHLIAGRRYRWNVAACNSRGCSNFTTPMYFYIPDSRLSAEVQRTGVRIMSRQQAQNSVELWIRANRRADGFIYREEIEGKFRHECVELVKIHSRTENIGTWMWRAGARIDPTGASDVSFGTPIATFLAKGTYPQKEDDYSLEDGSLPHAAIFIAYAGDPTAGEVTGMWIIDQYSVNGGKPAGVSFDPLSEKEYSVIQF